MNGDLVKAIQQLVREYGEQIFQNPGRLRALLADYAPDMPQSEINEALAAIAKGQIDDFLPFIQIVEPPAPIATEAVVSLAAYEEKVREADELRKRIDELPVKDTQVSLNNNMREKYKKRFFWALVAFIVTFIAAIVLNGILERERNEALGRASYLQNEYEAKQNEYEAKKKLWVIDVTDMKVGNADRYNQWITKPGTDKLIGSKMRFINPVWIYNAERPLTLTFFIKVIRPDGEVATYVSGLRSPAGYSFSKRKELIVGENQTLDLDGFGGWSNGMSSGTWTIELYNMGTLLYSDTVYLE
jgi:hypothetical protein